MIQHAPTTAPPPWPPAEPPPTPVIEPQGEIVTAGAFIRTTPVIVTGAVMTRLEVNVYTPAESVRGDDQTTGSPGDGETLWPPPGEIQARIKAKNNMNGVQASS